ncbi:MAG: alanine racemase [Hyphomonadaceae bacterium]|nr:alanine racemase [Hyphomonadaceae bacterium]
MNRNLARLDGHLRQFEVGFRPHLKTAKSIEVASRMMRSPAGPATVSTLAEAEAFAGVGVADILYAVGIAPGKLQRVLALRRRGVELSIILDSIEQAREVAKASREAGMPLPVLVEIDSDGHRAGVRPDDPLLFEIAAILDGQGARLEGVLTHAGGSYDLVGKAALERAAEEERLAVVTAAKRLRAAGHACPVVSVGSTPTAHFARSLEGVTEVRAGVFVFFDLVMAGVGVCAIDDIALSVLATVIGLNRDSGRVFVDAGWMALSRDRGTASQDVDHGYGLVCDAAGRPFPDLIVSQANQEHGVLTLRPKSGARLPDLPIGAQVRILPNHACATAAQHSAYHVIDANGSVDKVWPRISGW